MGRACRDSSSAPALPGCANETFFAATEGGIFDPTLAARGVSRGGVGFITCFLYDFR